MLETLELIVLQFLILSVAGLAALAPLNSEVRQKLLPAAPIFGAVLIAVITNWTSRWLSIRTSLPIIGGVALCLIGFGLYKRTRPFRTTRAAMGMVALALAASIGGFTLAAAPVAVVGDTDAVAPAYGVDGLYFAGVSTYLVDHPLLPGPTMTDRWVGNDPPATAPAADTVSNRLRFGQSAVAAVLSVVVGQPPYRTVNSISLLLLLLLGIATAVSARLLRLSKRAAFAASLLTTSSFFVVAQPLQGQNDGLLGISIALLAMSLSLAVLRERTYAWPLVLVVAGLAATYSEFFTLLAPALALVVLLGRRARFRHRLNVLGGLWAAAALLAPWAFIWLVQSFKLASRLTYGRTPFTDRTGWDLFRTYLGIGTFGPASTNTLLSIVGIAIAAVLSIGWVAALAWHEARGALLGLIVVVAGLEIMSIRDNAGNLQLRVVQLSVSALLIFGVAGWDILLRRVRNQGSHNRRAPARAWLLGSAAVLIALAFVGANLTTVGRTTSYDRARTQHIPARFIATLTAFVDRVGPEKVAVVAPNLTDESSLSLALTGYRGVEYPVIVPSSSYVGLTPLWSRRSDPYYVLGPGATVFGEVTFIARDGRYAIVHLGPSGMIVTPFGGAWPWVWPRVTWMRGFPCGRAGVDLLIIRGGTEPGAFQTATASTASTARKLAGIRLVDLTGNALRSTGRPTPAGRWLMQTFEAPQALNTILTVQPTQQLAAQGTVSFPLAFGPPHMLQPPRKGDGVTTACVASDDSGMDGYDREVFFMRSAP